MAGAGIAADMTQFMTQFGIGNKGIEQECFGVYFMIHESSVTEDRSNPGFHLQSRHEEMFLSTG